MKAQDTPRQPEHAPQLATVDLRDLRIMESQLALLRLQRRKLVEICEQLTGCLQGIMDKVPAHMVEAMPIISDLDGVQAMIAQLKHDHI